MLASMDRTGEDAVFLQSPLTARIAPGKPFEPQRMYEEDPYRCWRWAVVCEHWIGYSTLEKISRARSFSGFKGPKDVGFWSFVHARRRKEFCFGFPPEELSTRCGGQGVTIFFGKAKPVRAPQVGPARPAT
jgi:hypothetical protein